MKELGAFIPPEKNSKPKPSQLWLPPFRWPHFCLLTRGTNWKGQTLLALGFLCPLADPRPSVSFSPSPLLSCNIPSVRHGVQCSEHKDNWNGYPSQSSCSVQSGGNRTQRVLFCNRGIMRTKCRRSLAVCQRLLGRGDDYWGSLSKKYQFAMETGGPHSRPRAPYMWSHRSVHPGACEKRE